VSRRDTVSATGGGELEVLHPAAGARALEVLALAVATAPLGEPDPLQMEHFGDEERHDPGQELGAGEDVHHRNLPPRSPSCSAMGRQAHFS